MKIISTLFLLTAAFEFTTPTSSSNNRLVTYPAVCSPLSTLDLYIKDLNAYPTQSDIIMAQAQILSVDKELQCPTSYGTLDSEKPASDACKKNQELKDAIGEIRFVSPDDKRIHLKGLTAACLELAGMLGCLAK